MNPPSKKLVGLFAAALTFISASPVVQAVNASANGIYSGSGTTTQVLVVKGRPVSNAVLNNHQSFASVFTSTTDGILNGVINVTYSFVETRGQSTFTVRYYDSSDNSLLLTFISVIKVSVTDSSDTGFRTKTEWEMRMESSSIGNQILSSVVISESYTFNLSAHTCIYVYDNGPNITLTRIGTGNGSSQGSPLIPNNPKWDTNTPLAFPIISPNSTIFCDPPFASAFDYKIAPNRKERFASIKLPKGFGSKIEVLAQPSNGGSLVKVGTYKSGTKIDLLANPAFAKGTKKFTIRKIKPKVSLKKKAPYPVGLTFTSLDQSAAKILIKGKKK